MGNIEAGLKALKSRLLAQEQEKVDVKELLKEKAYLYWRSFG